MRSKYLTAKKSSRFLNLESSISANYLKLTDSIYVSNENEVRCGNAGDFRWLFAGNRIKKSWAVFSNDDLQAIESAARNLSFEFQLKKNAIIRSRKRVHSSGTLNLRKISNYRFSDKIFKAYENTPKQKNHGVIMVLDMSSSILDYAKWLAMQALVMAKFCQSNKIPFRVVAFTTFMEAGGKILEDVITSYATSKKIKEQLSKNNWQQEKRYLLEICSNKNSAKDILLNLELLLLTSGVTGYNTPANILPLRACFAKANNAEKYHLVKFGNTPLEDAFFSLIGYTDEFRAENSSLDVVTTLVLTDGVSAFSNPGASILDSMEMYRSIGDGRGNCVEIPETKLGENFSPESMALASLNSLRNDQNFVLVELTNRRDLSNREKYHPEAQSVSSLKNKSVETKVVKLSPEQSGLHVQRLIEVNIDPSTLTDFNCDDKNKLAKSRLAKVLTKEISTSISARL
jgi:hypothetical protein